MNFIRNFFCLLVIIFVVGILLINTESVRNRAKELIQAEFKEQTGYNLEVGSIEFNFPRSIVLYDILVVDTPQGDFRAKSFTLNAPLLKLIFGERNELSGIIDFEGLEADNPAIKEILPTTLRTLIAWNADHQTIQGTIFRLESTHQQYSYALESKEKSLDTWHEQNSAPKGEFKVFLGHLDEADHTLICAFDKVRTPTFVLEDLAGTGKWDQAIQQGRFSLLANKIVYGNFSLSKFGIEVKSDPDTGHWHYEFSTDGMAADPFKAAIKGVFGIFNGFPQLILNDLNFESKGHTIALKKPFDIRLEENFDFVIAQAQLNVNQQDLSLSGRTNLQDLDLRMDVFKQPFNYTISGEASPMTGVLSGSFFLQGTLDNLFGGADLKVNSFSYTLPGETSPITGEFSGTISLQGTLDNLHAGTEINLKSFCYDFPGANSPSIEGLSGTISLQGTPNNLHGGADIKVKSCSYIPHGKTSPITAALSGAVSLEGAYDNLRGSAEFKASSISIEHPFLSKKALFEVGLSANLLDEVLSMKGVLMDREVKLLEVTGDCPLVREEGRIAPSRYQNMALHLSGQVDLVKYLRKAISSDLWVTGEAIANVDISGPFHAPIINGNLKWQNGGVEHWESGLLLHSAHADFSLSNDKITLQSLQAMDENGGKVLAAGVAEWTSALNFPFQVNLSVDRGHLLNLDDLSIFLSGKGTFIGDVTGATLKGDFIADAVDLAVTDSASTKYDPLDIIYINQTTEVPLPTQINRSADKWPICYDLHVQNKGNISIYSKEFSSEWKGDLKITGCNTLPLFSGDLRLIKGEYLFNGKKLKVAEGTITFAGDLKKKTTLYVVVEMEIDRIVAQIVLKGPLNNPSLAFRSTPPMSQREILSYVLFGRGMRDITPFQGTELVQSLNELKAGAGSADSNVLSRIKESLGIDRIDISGGEGGVNEEISLQVGKYILPEVFLGIKRNMNSDVNRIGIEASLIKNVKLEAELGDDAGAQVHLKWKHDY